MSGKRAFLELLKQEGVEILFGNPGTTELPLMDALAVDNELRYVLGLQEATVIGMADGYAQASGKLAVVNLSRHAGPRQCHGHALRRAEGRQPDPGHRWTARPGLQRNRADPVG
ncbi:MAG: thiamine pyrophosphate-binding protein [Xanthobacteraceae bacterium]